jgi:transcription elongation factor Elf1
MYIPKKYGQSKKENCPFCGKDSVSVNSQGVPVCLNHKDNKILDLKCACGAFLDVRSGKFGPYFNCMNCGNINFRKGLEMNPGLNNAPKSEEKENPVEKKEIKKEYPKERKEITVRSDDPSYF